MTTLTDLIETFRTRRWLSVTVGGVLLALFMLGDVVVPRMQDAAAAVQSWNAQVARVDAATDLPARLQRVRMQQQDYRDELDSLYVHVPRGDRISVILGTLQETATASGVTLFAVRPGDPSTHDTYDKLLLDVVVEGRFHPIGRFLSRVERSAHLIVVDELRLERVEERGRDLRATLRLGLVTLRADGSESP